MDYSKEQWIDWYVQKVEMMGAAYTEVSPLEFYRDMFDGLIQSRGGLQNGKGNALVDIIAYYENRTESDKKDERAYSRKYVMTDDYEALRYMNPQKHTREESRLCLCSPCTYFGIHKSNEMAHELAAVALDLDYVGVQQLKNVMKQIGNGARIMPPNYIVNSGRGLHLYYFLERPVPCYQYVMDGLTQFKSVLQNFIWNETSSLRPEKPDHGAITQAFRMVGSESKLGKQYIVRAYRVREQRWTITELYRWVQERAPSFLKGCPLPELKDPLEVYRRRHPLTLTQALEKYPDWNPDNPNKKWNIKGQKGHRGDELYQWWIRKIKEKAIVGGRYYSILALAAYGSKCDIPFSQVERDALDLFPHLERLTNDETNHFKKSDIQDALRFYKNNTAKVTYRLTRGKISELTKIDIPPNKRNGRKQNVHLARARAVQDIDYPNHEWAGRPKGSGTAQKKVQEWKQQHPDGKKIECHRDTGMSRVTIDKWWDKPIVPQRQWPITAEMFQAWLTREPTDLEKAMVEMWREEI